VTVLLDGQVAAHPDDLAVVDERGSTTWAELDRRVARLIAGLRAAGVSPGASVVGMLGNQVEFVELSLACMQGGWRLVPVNWHWVADELAYVLDDADAAALVVDHRWLDVAEGALADADVPVRLVVGDVDLPEGFDAYPGTAASEVAPGEPERGGPMFYTSGTTGRPKGVRGALAQVGGPPEIWQLMAHSLRDTIQLPESGAVQAICGPLYHSAQWVFASFSLLCGARLVLQHRFDAAELLELVDRHGVTNLHLVPTQMSRLLRVDPERRDAFDGSSVRAILHGAAPCPEPVKRAMIDWFGPVVTEYYGGTEGGFISTITSPEWLERPRSVGRPLPVIEVLVVDAEGRPCGPGEPGDLYFRSLLGSDFEYHNAPDKTEAAHLEPGVGTLGDIGYLDEDGYLYLSDRRIDMIVSGGVNIYPAEVESVLAEHPAVLDVAVFGIPDDDMGESVRAALELAPGAVAGEELEAELVELCRSRLAGYKVPRSFEVHEQLPRTVAGKLLKRELRDPWWTDRDRAI
jgi:long-chain acyl-CoA synthetase